MTQEARKAIAVPGSEGEENRTGFNINFLFFLTVIMCQKKLNP